MTKTHMKPTKRILLIIVLMNMIKIIRVVLPTIMREKNSEKIHI